MVLNVAGPGKDQKLTLELSTFAPLKSQKITNQTIISRRLFEHLNCLEKYVVQK
jgi:hypothetical protein